VALRIEQLRFPIRVDFDAPRSVALANEAVDLATRLGCDEAQAVTLLGSALLIDGSSEWPAAIERGRTLARRAGDVDAELEAANALTAAHLLSGDRRIARTLATESWQTARSAHRGHWEQQFSVLANLLGLIDGDLAEVAEWGRAEVGLHLSAGAQTAYGTYAVALADLGRQHAALTKVREGMSLAKGDETGTCFLQWAAAEARWLLGQPTTALDAAQRSLSCAVAGFPVRPLAGAVRAWCQFDAGLPVTEAEEAGWDFARAARIESRGVALLAAGDHAGAAESLAEAAELADDAPRFSLRARWGLGEVWRRAGEHELAIAVLLDVHDTAERRGFMALHGRCHRSLRQLGWTHGPAPDRHCPLTPRQREVLELVCQGHTTQETASILGVGPSTVETHVCDAMARLGATTRAQAALLAAPWLTRNVPRGPAST
jgi:DNA-binding CsgD family transcriptional regulator/tetratricopeptide (TPR) repeat protein